MSEIYVFNPNGDELLTILSDSNGLISAPFRDELNNVASESFKFTVEASAEYSHGYDSTHNLTQIAGQFIGTLAEVSVASTENVSPAQFVKEENRVVFRDREGEFREYVIKEIDDIDGLNGAETTAICIPSFVEELSNNIVVERRFNEQQASVALNAALQDTRWNGVIEISLGLATTNFYYISSLDAIWRILDVWGGDLKDIVYLSEDKTHIASREIRIQQRRGSDKGLRCEIDHNIDEIQRTIISYPKTALYGRGASLEIEDDEGQHTGGYTRYIDFADVEWKVSNGDPVNKPLGQRWVGDPDALQQYGYDNGQLLHRYGIYHNQDYEEPADLLRATWEYLQEQAKYAEVNYRLSVDLFNEPAELGDSAIAIDREFARPIEIQSRIIAIEYDLLDIEGTTVVEMGQHLNLDDDRLDRIADDIERNRGRWEHPKVDESSYPNIKPSRPTNVTATGAFETIQVWWDYADEIYIKHYEVYGSQVADFVPDSQHLLWCGQVSAFGHTANTDETWYYYVRAVNYHGTASDWSTRVSASTVRVMSDDILFGPDLAAELRVLSETTQLLADGTIDFDMFDTTIIEGNRIKGDLIAVDGTSYIADGVIGTAAIADAAIARAHLQDAIIVNAHIEDTTIESAKIKSVAADKIDATELSAISANLGTVSSGRMETLEIAGINYPSIYFGSKAAPSGIINYFDNGMRFMRDNFTYYRVNQGGANPGSRVLHQMYAGGSVIFNFGVSTGGHTTITSNNGIVKFSADNQEIQFRNSSDTGYQNIRSYNINANNIEVFAVFSKYNTNRRMLNDFNNGNVSVNAVGGVLYLGYEQTTSIQTGVDLIARNFIASGGTFQSTSANAIIRASASGSRVYLQANHEVRATTPGTAESYIVIGASNFAVRPSHRENKKEIELFKDDILAQLKNFDAHLYHVKGQGFAPYKQLGLMIDDTPSVLHGVDGQGMDMYALGTYALIGVKQLDEKVDCEIAQLKDRIKQLEENAA